MLIVRLFRHPHSTALTISASLAQIGEFSFILAGLGVSRSRCCRSAGATSSSPARSSRSCSIRCSSPGSTASARPSRAPSRQPADAGRCAGAAARAGAGGNPADDACPTMSCWSAMAASAASSARSCVKTGTPLLVIEDDVDRVDRLKGKGPRDDHRQCRRSGGACAPPMSRRRAACWWRSRMRSRAGRWWRRRASSTQSLPIMARAHSEAEIEHLKKHGATQVVMGEHEIAKAMIAAHPAGGAASPAATHAGSRARRSRLPSLNRRIGAALAQCSCVGVAQSVPCNNISRRGRFSRNGFARRRQPRHSACGASGAGRHPVEPGGAALRRAVAAGVPAGRHAGGRSRPARHQVRRRAARLHRRLGGAGADPVRRRLAHPLPDLPQRDLARPACWRPSACW